MSYPERMHLPELEPEQELVVEGHLAAPVLPRTEQGHVVAQLRMLERIYAVVENANRFRSPEQRLDVLLHAFLQSIPGAQRGTIYLSIPVPHVFMFGAVFPGQPSMIGTMTNAKGSYVDAVDQVKCPILLPGSEQETSSASPTAQTGAPPAKAGLAAPFIVGGRTVGVISLENADQEDVFTQQDLEIAELLATHSAMIVDNARLMMTRSRTGEWQLPELNAAQALSASLPLGVLFVTHDRRRVWGNPVFCRMTGYAVADLERNLFRIHRSLVQNPCVPENDDGQVCHELSLTRQDRSLCPARAVFVDLAALGIRYPSGYIGVFEDMREKKELERQLFHLQHLTNLSKIASGVAHELNGPLTAVIGFTELLLGGHDLPADLAKDLRTIIKQAERSTEITRTLLDYVHLAEHKSEPVDLNAVLRQLARFCEFAEDSEGTEIRLDLAEPPLYVTGDAQQLQQVILSLIDNAEYTCRAVNRDCRLSISTELISTDQVRIAVHDNGPGIPDEVQARVFEPFFTTKPVGEGTGLGLAVSQQIVTQHRGQIWFQSTTGEGTTFFIDLPTTSPVADEEPCSRSAARPSSATTPPARILVIDDERSIGNLLTKVLTKTGHHVDVALDGRQALAKMRQYAYDIVFLDLKIPDLPGQAIYDWIKGNLPHLAERTIILTGDTLSAETISFLEQECTTHLLKPFQLVELRGVLDRVWAA
jgi:signal transduction histidine kinase/CheY-like chemotaxis protein